MYISEFRERNSIIPEAADILDASEQMRIQRKEKKSFLFIVGYAPQKSARRVRHLSTT